MATGITRKVDDNPAWTAFTDGPEPPLAHRSSFCGLSPQSCRSLDLLDVYDGPGSRRGLCRRCEPWIEWSHSAARGHLKKVPVLNLNARDAKGASCGKFRGGDSNRLGIDAVVPIEIGHAASLAKMLHPEPGGRMPRNASQPAERGRMAVDNRHEGRVFRQIPQKRLNVRMRRPVPARAGPLCGLPACV